MHRLTLALIVGASTALVSVTTLSLQSGPVTARDAAESARRPGGKHLTFPAGPVAGQPLLRAAEHRSLPADGAALFYRDWLKTVGSDGPLAGPDLDASSCPACHVETAVRAPGTVPVQAPPIARPAWPADAARYGPQLRTRRNDRRPAQATVRIAQSFRPYHYPDGLVVTLSYPITHARTPSGDRVAVALRAAPLLFGWGLLEHVDTEMLSHLHDPDDRNEDGISGRLAQAGAGSAPGLFGWKGAHASLREQIAAALASDIGVLSQAHCQTPCDAEISPAELDALTAYVRHLGVPERRGRADARGERLFGTTGCSGCHVPALLTHRSGETAFADQLIWPYSDLLLHDMGPALADPGGRADAREWRTAPLWGLGVIEAAIPERGFLHDGRARSIEEAILWHGGEAAPARKRFARLPPAERRALLEFVRSL